MAIRDLTSNERAVLEHVVLDADAWWSHANAWEKTDHEAALAGKVARYQDAYDEALAAGDYKTRAERDALESA